MKVGIITFHASHNYGSMLQAYALQQVVMSLGHECEIINFRTKRKKKFYRPFFTKYVRGIAKAIAYPMIAFDVVRKHCLFEEFLKTYLILSKNEYSTNKQLKKTVFDYDAYISGSDQIWNTICFDFDSSYFLDFTTCDRKIAYAPSMGPSPMSQVNPQQIKGYANVINQYTDLSVREEGTAEYLKKILGIEATVTIDPTLLLASDKWDRIAGDIDISTPYIFLYTPWYDHELYQIAADLADKFNCKVVCTIEECYRFWKSHPRFVYRLATGPVEFLGLIKNASFIVSGSFHAVIFSLLNAKPFYAHNGMQDNRISSILKKTNLEFFAQLPDDEIWSTSPDIIRNAFAKLNPEICRSLKFLKNALA